MSGNTPLVPPSYMQEEAARKRAAQMSYDQQQQQYYNPGFDTSNYGRQQPQRQNYAGVGGNMYTSTKTMFKRAGKGYKLPKTWVLTTPSTFPHNDQRMFAPEISPDEFPQWFQPFGVWLAYFFIQLAISATFCFVAAYATIEFGNTLDTMSRFLYGACMSGAMVFIILASARFVGAMTDVWMVLGASFADVCFNPKWNQMKHPWLMRFSVLGKVIVILMGIVCGSFIGLLPIAGIYGGAIATSDCATEFVILCLAKPKINYINVTQAQFTMVFGFVVLAIANFVGWGMVKKRSMFVQPLPGNAPLIHDDDTQVELEESKTVTVTRNPENESSSEITTKEMLPHYHPKKQISWMINENWTNLAIFVGGAWLIVMALNGPYVGMGWDLMYFVAVSRLIGDLSLGNVYVGWNVLAVFLVFLGISIFMLGSRITEDYRAKALKKVENLSAVLEEGERERAGEGEEEGN